MLLLNVHPVLSLRRLYSLLWTTKTNKCFKIKTFQSGIFFMYMQKKLIPVVLWASEYDKSTKSCR